MNQTPDAPGVRGSKVESPQPTPAPPGWVWEWRKGMKWLLAQFVVIVLSVLAALALNAWYQDRLDIASESHYLRLLSRDLQATVDDLEEEAEFEALQIEDGLAVYRALSAGLPPENTAALSLAMARLGTRHTMALKDSTYRDLISTGKLHLIRDVELRDRIVRFYQDTARAFDVINRNNAFYIDAMYKGNVILSGLILLRPGSNAQVQIPADRMLESRLRGGYVGETDRLWTLPADAPEWTMVKSNLLARLRIAAIAHSLGDGRLRAARDLQAAIAAQLAE